VCGDERGVWREDFVVHNRQKKQHERESRPILNAFNVLLHPAARPSVGIGNTSWSNDANVCRVGITIGSTLIEHCVCLGVRALLCELVLHLQFHCLLDFLNLRLQLHLYARTHLP